MEVAFHVAGLNYGDSTDTENVLKKMLRTLSILRTYHPPQMPIHIYFLSPKARRRVRQTLETKIAALQEACDDVLAGIRRLLDGESGLERADGRDVFEGRFGSLRDSGLSPQALYRDILRDVFHAGINDVLRLGFVRGSSGEIGLKANNAMHYFGVVTIGDAGSFRKLVAERAPEILMQEEAVLGRSLRQHQHAGHHHRRAGGRPQVHGGLELLARLQHGADERRPPRRFADHPAVRARRALARPAAWSETQQRLGRCASRTHRSFGNAQHLRHPRRLHGAVQGLSATRRPAHRRRGGTRLADTPEPGVPAPRLVGAAGTGQRGLRGRGRDGAVPPRRRRGVSGSVAASAVHRKRKRRIRGRRRTSRTQSAHSARQRATGGLEPRPSGTARLPRTARLPEPRLRPARHPRRLRVHRSAVPRARRRRQPCGTQDTRGRRRALGSGARARQEVHGPLLPAAPRTLGQQAHALQRGARHGRQLPRLRGARSAHRAERRRFGKGERATARGHQAANRRRRAHLPTRNRRTAEHSLRPPPLPAAAGATQRQSHIQAASAERKRTPLRGRPARLLPPREGRGPGRKRAVPAPQPRPRPRRRLLRTPRLLPRLHPLAEKTPTPNASSSSNPTA